MTRDGGFKRKDKSKKSNKLQQLEKIFNFVE